MGDRLGEDLERTTRNLLQEMLVVSVGLEDFLGRLVEAGGSLLAGHGTGVLTSVTLLRPRTKVTIAGSCVTARRLADAQHGFDDGPGIEAVAARRTVDVVDLATDSAYPLYSPVALRLGIRSGLGVPVQLEGPEQAILNYSSPDPGAFTPEMIQAANLFAADVSTPLMLALRIARLTDRAEQLAAAMESRTTIDLAVGVMMAQNHCSQEDAIDILRAASSARNLKLHDLASRVLTSTADAPVSTHFA